MYNRVNSIHILPVRNLPGSGRREDPVKITVVAVGKIKEKYFRDAIEEYSRRLGRFCRLELIEVADEKTPEGAGALMELSLIHI